MYKNPVYMLGFELKTFSISIHDTYHYTDILKKEARSFYKWGELSDLYSVGF